MMKVLLVEDNRADARLFAELLREVSDQRFALTTVERLASALDVVATHDVVFLDLSLPDAHGLTGLERMAAAAPLVPIVMLTGNADATLAVEAVKAGAQDYLNKGDITPQLIARVARYAVERKRAEEQRQRLAIADQVSRRARLLSAVSSLVAASFGLDHLDLDQTLPAVAQLLVPDLADACTIELGEPPPARDGSVVVPLVARDRVLGALVLQMPGDDVELRRLAGEVADRIALGIDNARLYQAAQSAIRARDELLAVVSHDLRNPLGVVQLALQMMQSSPDAVESALPRAQRAADRMEKLIADLLEVARIESGTLAIDPQPVDVAAVLDEAFDQHRPLAAAKHITLLRDDTRDLLGTAVVDRHRLVQALSNLMSNALKFTPAGGTIRLGAERTGEGVAFHVSDTGPGIPRDHQDRIFDRFWQRDRTKGGIGLGLAIVKGIVDAHGGAIEIDSAPGAGATFTIALKSAAHAAA